MNQYIFITSRLDKNHGGLTASLLNKTRIFNEKLNVKPLILTFHLDRTIVLSFTCFFAIWLLGSKIYLTFFVSTSLFLKYSFIFINSALFCKLYRYNLQNKAEFININEYFRNKDVDTKKVKYIFEPNNQMAKKQVNDSTIVLSKWKVKISGLTFNFSLKMRVLFNSDAVNPPWFLSSLLVIKIYWFILSPSFLSN